MMYMHYCQNCQKLHMLNGHKLFCPACDFSLTELKLSYLDYVEMDLDQRELLIEQLRTKEGLDKMSTIYRMQKYSQWYKEQNIKIL